jgi:hypothetical protein
MDSFDERSAPVSSDETWQPEGPPFPLGSRLAGAGLVLAAAAVLATLLGGSHTALPSGLAWVIAGVDVLAGLVLLAGVRIARGPAIGWTALSAALIAGFGMASGSVFFACSGVLLRGGVALLLAGAPRGGRLAGGSALVMVAWIAMLGGVVVGAVKTWAVDLTTEELPSTSVAGRKTAYRLEVPRAGGWRRFKDDAARKQNPEVDLWLMAPDKGAQVLVIAESIDEGALTSNALADAIVRNARTRYSQYEELRRGYPAHAVKHVVLLDSRGTIGRERVEELVAIFVEGEVAYQIHAIVPQDRFAALESELEDILLSFAPPREPAPTELPEAPLALPVPIPPDPRMEGKDLRRFPAVFLSWQARAW